MVGAVVVVLTTGGFLAWRLPRQITDAALRTVVFSVRPVETAAQAPGAVSAPLPIVRRSPAAGPLRIDPANPRYFVNPAGQAVLLTGSHTWMNLQDIGDGNPPPKFDFDAYLDLLVAHNHDFFRLWSWEQSRWAVELADNDLQFFPLPYVRTGPGTALDGSPQFDLTQFNQAYFDRMRQRIVAAGQRGIYLSVMLFQGWGVSSSKDGLSLENPWHAHPYNAANNIHHINGDVNGDDSGDEVHSLAVPAVTALQEAYVRKVVDTVNALPNVLYEISNESPETSISWENYFVNFVKQYEATKPFQHPVGMTATFPGDNRQLFASDADWISPNSAGRRSLLFGHWGNVESPIVNDGAKVILNDTDHLCGICADHKLFWRGFMRGLNRSLLILYGFDSFGVGATNFHTESGELELIRQNMGYILSYANRVDLASMAPRCDLCTSGYCLANLSPNAAAYLVYLPDGAKSTLNVAAAAGDLAVEWFIHRPA